ncbi:MAG: hypothetical protein WCH78_02970 [Bacteroidota bacterium]
MKKQSINTIAKRFFLGNMLVAMFFLSANANTGSTRVSIDPTKKIEVKYVGTEKENMFFNVKFNNESGKSFKVYILDELGEVIFSNKYSEKSFDKKFIFPTSQDINKLTFLIQSDKGSYKEIFDVAVKTNTVSEVSVTKK